MDEISNYSNYSDGRLQVVPRVKEGSFLYQDNQGLIVPQAEARVREPNLYRESQSLQFQEVNTLRETFFFEENNQELETANRYAVVVQEVPQIGEIVKKNFQDLQTRFPYQQEPDIDIRKDFRLSSSIKEMISIRIRAPDLSENLPIFTKKVKGTIAVPVALSATLQGLGCTTILDLLKKSFPKLTKDLKGEIPRYVFSCPVPLNHQDKGSFFPQIETKEEIAYIAWDPSGFQIAKGFKRKTFNVVFENGKASSDLLQVGLFMISKVTMIGICIINSISAGSNSLANEESLDLEASLGAKDLPDREIRLGEQLVPFCIDIALLGSAEQIPVQKSDLIMAIDMQYQR